MNPNLTKIINGGVITIILVLSLFTLTWDFDKEESSLYRDGDLLAKHRWEVDAQRTYINKNSWYRTNIMCPKIIKDGGYETPTRCYYAPDTYQMLSRSIKNTDLNINEFTVYRNTPHYKYGTRGSYAGFLEEIFKFEQTKSELEFPKQYNIKWEPKDTRNYKLVWRVWKLVNLSLPDGEYHNCVYNPYGVKIDLKGDCSRLEKAVVKDNSIFFYFNPEKGTQYMDVSLVDPVVDI
ncbi:hypothetical protein LCGC14_2037440, partial [marine sediment metagenome]